MTKKRSIITHQKHLQIFCITIILTIVSKIESQQHCFSCLALSVQRQRPPKRRIKLPPHAGYHGEAALPGQPFFEGWYLRITPTTEHIIAENNDDRSTFGDEEKKNVSNLKNTTGPLAFIFHVFDPHMPSSSRHGVGIQALTPLGSVFCESNHKRDVANFKGDEHCLNIKGNNNNDSLTPSSKSGSFSFDLTERHARGTCTSTSPPIPTGTTKTQNSNLPTSGPNNNGMITTTVDFDFDMLAEIGWGGGHRFRQYSTAGWLAAFPFFEPHYQVVISKGAASGHVRVTTEINQEGHKPRLEQQDRQDTQKSSTESLPPPTNTTTNFEFTNATVYLEKNWGSSFPSAWWWIQANFFPNEPDLCITSTGGSRKLPITNQEEEVALIGIHWKGLFLPFSTVEWSVQWGEWNIKGSAYENYTVELKGNLRPNDDESGSGDEGVGVLCPTSTGMKEIAVETYTGILNVKLFQNGKVILDETTSDACLEIGGSKNNASFFARRKRKDYTKPHHDQPQIWNGKSKMKEPLKTIVMNRDLERLGADALQIVNMFVNVPGL